VLCREVTDTYAIVERCTKVASGENNLQVTPKTTKVANEENDLHKACRDGKTVSEREKITVTAELYACK